MISGFSLKSLSEAAQILAILESGCSYDRGSPQTRALTETGPFPKTRPVPEMRPILKATHVSHKCEISHTSSPKPLLGEDGSGIHRPEPYRRGLHPGAATHRRFDFQGHPLHSPDRRFGSEAVRGSGGASQAICSLVYPLPDALVVNLGTVR